MLTGSQHKTLAYIREYFSKNSFAPSLSDIADGLGIKSRGVVHRYVHALADAGYIQLIPGRQRNIQLNENSADELPLLGQIAAGKPIEAIENKQSVNVSHELVGDNRYALRVKGDSMIDAGILDGDVVIIKNQNTARNGDIVVALIDNYEATLKRFKKIMDNKIKLSPENSSMKPMIYQQSRVTIQGILVGQFRSYNQHSRSVT